MSDLSGGTQGSPKDEIMTAINAAISPMQNGIISIQSSLLNIENNIQTLLSAVPTGVLPAGSSGAYSSDETSQSGGRRRGKRATRRSAAKRKGKKSRRHH
jgi:hypothetical protein